MRFRPPFRGFRLKDGVFQPISESRIVDGAQVFASKVVGLELHGHCDTLRWVDPRTEAPLPIRGELYDRIESEKDRADAEGQRADAERQRANAERKRADVAEAELARLRRKMRD